MPGVRVADDLVERKFRPNAPNVLWVADITYLRTWEGWLYLAAVQDAYSRRIVGWAMTEHMRTTLVPDALRMALTLVEPAAEVRPHTSQRRGAKLDSTGPRNTLIVEVVLMGRPAGWMRELTGRAPMKSPGHPTHRREVERLFWREIVEGLSSEDAALAVGASQAAGSRWFRERGGMPTFMLAALSGRYLSFQEREEIAMLKSQGVGVREIARRLGRSRRRSRGSCAATRRLVAGSSTIARRSRNGRQSWSRAARRQRSSPPTSGFASMCRSGSRARFAGRTGRRCRARDGALEGPQQAAPPGPPVGERVEPGADLCPAEDRLPR